MGLDIQNLRALLAAKASGVDFSHAATLGRQSIKITPQEVARVMGEFSIPADPAASAAASGEYADELYHRLSGHEFESVDASGYESATLIQDLNQPLSPGLKERFTLLIDGGSLEHVYSIPQAFTNCADMIKVGGHLLICNIANNFCGHGFYQFSPELFWRTFGKENGFEMQWMVFAEYGGSEKWTLVPDPAVVGERLNFTNCAPLYLFALAKKVRPSPSPLLAPQQSDYVSLWQGESGKAGTGGLLSGLPVSWKIRLRSVLRPYARKHLRRVAASSLRASG